MTPDQKALLYRAAVLIRRNANRVDMRDWRYELKCGAVGCAAYWICVAAKREWPTKSPIGYKTVELLGLQWGHRLFFAGFWPPRFREALRRTRVGKRPYAEIVARRLERYADTGDLMADMEAA